MKPEFEIAIPLPLTTIGCSIAWLFAGAHLTPPWAFSFPMSVLIDATLGITFRLRKKTKEEMEKERLDDEWGNSSQP